MPPKVYPYGTLFLSALGRRYEAPQHPLVVYGHDALDTAAFVAEASTLCALAVSSLSRLEKAVAAHATIGMFAMSPPERSGDAAAALRRYAELNAGPALLLYGAWTNRPDEAVRRALAAGAHGVILPDTDAQEMFGYLFSLLQAIGEDTPLPATESAMLQHLRVAFPESPFWNAAAPAPHSDVV